MPAKSLLFHDAAREKLCAGLNTLSNAVKIKLGPKGRTVLGSGDCGYSAATEEYGDMMQMNIIDPTKITRLALQQKETIDRATFDALLKQWDQ